MEPTSLQEETITSSLFILINKLHNWLNFTNIKLLLKPSDGVPAVLLSWPQEEVQLIVISDSFPPTLWNKVSPSIQVKFLLISGSQICNLMFSKISN